MKGRGRGGVALLVIASLLATGLCVHAIHAGDNREHLLNSDYPLLNFSLHNGTVPDAAVQQEYGTTPAPITICRFELDQKFLPGPRYMAYGPGVITLAIDPRLLAVLLAIGVLITGAWYLLPGFGKDENE
jgi:hypothetical protein